MRQISRRMEMIHPTIGWRRDEHGTHKHARGSWILCSVSRVRSKTMQSLFCITSWLPYIILFTSIRDFFAPGTIVHRSIRLPPRVFARVLVGNKIRRINGLSTNCGEKSMSQIKNNPFGVSGLYVCAYWQIFPHFFISSRFGQLGCCWTAQSWIQKALPVTTSSLG